MGGDRNTTQLLPRRAAHREKKLYVPRSINYNIETNSYYPYQKLISFEKAGPQYPKQQKMPGPIVVRPTPTKGPVVVLNKRSMITGLAAAFFVSQVCAWCILEMGGMRA
jgi:hypothetical protein